MADPFLAATVSVSPSALFLFFTSPQGHQSRTTRCAGKLVLELG